MSMQNSKKHRLTEVIVILALTFIWNQLIYSGSRLITASWHHYDMTTAFDNSVPFLPWTISIYFGCYAFWGINYYLCATHSAPEQRYRFFSADMMAKGICLLFFLLIPTTNVRPEVTDVGIWGTLMRFLYTIDPADNLLPSIHCLASWLCWVGIRRRKDIPVLYRYFSLIFAVAVCVSTVTTKQHVVVDVIAGVLIAELCYLMAGINKIKGAYGSMIGKIVSKIKK